MARGNDFPPEQGATRRLDGGVPSRTPAVRPPKKRPGRPGILKPVWERPQPRKPAVAPTPKPAVRVAPRPIFPYPAVRRAPRIRLPGVLGFALQNADYLETMLFPKKWLVPNPLNGWRKCFGDCTGVNPNDSRQGATAYSPCVPNPTAYQCLSGQATGPLVGILPPEDTSAAYLLTYNALGASWRAVFHSRYQRQADLVGTVQADPVMIASMRMGYALRPMPDPNIARHTPTLPDLEVGFAEALQPTELSAEEVVARLEALPWTKTVIRAGSPPIGGSPGSAPPRVKPPVVGGKPHMRRRPKRGTKEKKVKGAIYYAFLIADAISEGAEVVDALFEALPKDVQKRWKCNRSVAFIDKAGQYGIDNADCKAKAVFHNLHKIDGVDAIRNIIANQAEDKLIGALHKRLPRNMINAGEDGQKAYGEIVQSVLEELGLKEGNGFDFI